MAQLNARPTGDQEAEGSTPSGAATFFQEIFSQVMLSLPLIQKGQVSFWRKNVPYTG